MIRNALLLVLSAGVLLALFAGYRLLLEPAGHVRQRGSDGLSMPPPEDVGRPAAVRIGGMELPEGKALEFTLYDERTGQPRQSFRCESYTAVPGSKNEISVTRPEMVVRLPSGMIALVSAERGQLATDRVDQVRARPKNGWLEGTSRIEIDRCTDPNRAPLSERPGDRIRVETERMDFDLNLGSLRAEGPVRVDGTEFEIEGTGLELVWNQADNRVETLEVRQGRRLSFDLESGLFAPHAQDPNQPASSSPADPHAPTPLREGASPRGARGRRVAYRGSMLGQVVAEQLRTVELPDGGSELRRVGGITAERLDLLFDMGGAADSALASRRPERAPGGPRERLLVQWTGPFRLEPVAAPLTDQPRRQRIEASGAEVRVQLPAGEVRCGGLSYHQESQRLWLRPGADGRVLVDMSERLSCSAAGVYYDGARGAIKLVGDVRLSSRDARGGVDRSLRITCDLWAELRSGAQARGADASAVLAGARLDQARFVGQVRVTMGDRTLTASQLDAFFKPAPEDSGTKDPDDGAAPTEDDSLAARFERAVALGDVVLASEDRRVTAARVDLTFERGADGEPYPRRVLAEGGVRLLDGRRSFRAAGQRLLASFVSARELERARISGSETRNARVWTDSLSVTGWAIDLDELSTERDTLALHVAGWSDVRFRSRRSMQGRERARAASTRVVSQTLLEVDFRPQRNQIRFVGEVTADSGDERIQADALMLTLGPPGEERQEGPPADRGGERSAVLSASASLTFGAAPVVAWGALRALASPSGATLPAGAPDTDVVQAVLARVGLVRGAAAEVDLGRGLSEREPVGMLATNAVLESESYVAGDPQPLVRQSIEAPELRVDIPARALHTRGQTRLGLVNRRMQGADEAEAGSLGVPSALLTRGPNQTLLQCEDSLTYTLGPDSGRRADRVLLQGAVRLGHVAGREMVNVEKMLPQVRENPRLLDELETRNTYLESQRLEGELAPLEASAAGGAGGRARALQLNWVSASGSVYLSDRRGPAIRSLEAHEIEFDREEGVIRVLGSADRDARVFNENTQTGRIDVPVVGRELLIDLKRNTVKSGDIRGELRTR
jgi:lipopolysaccharide export system protein LptA